MGEKRDIQEEQYATPYHWDMSKRVENSRYKHLTKIIASKIIQHSRDPDHIVIDYGCGDGYGTYLLYNHLKKDKRRRLVMVDGYDKSDKAIEWAEIMVQAATMKRLDIYSSVSFMDELYSNLGELGVVIMREVLEHLSIEHIDKELKNLVTEINWGIIVVTVPSVNAPIEDKHYRHYTQDDVRDVFIRNGIEPLEILGFGFRPKFLYKVLNRAKSILNGYPVLWRLMEPLWSIVPPSMAMTIVGIGKFDNE